MKLLKEQIRKPARTRVWDQITNHVQGKIHTKFRDHILDQVWNPISKQMKS